MIETLSIDSLFEAAYRDLDRFITDEFDAIRASINLTPTYSIRCADKYYAEAWTTGFRRCLAMFQQAADRAKRQEKLNGLAEPDSNSDTANADPPKGKNG